MIKYVKYAAVFVSVFVACSIFLWAVFPNPNEWSVNMWIIQALFPLTVAGLWLTAYWANCDEDEEL